MDWPGHTRRRSTLRPVSATTATARSPTSRAAPASTSRCTAWASPSATSTTTAFPICSSPASDRTGCSATPARARSSTSPARAASPDARPSARRRCGSISTATACSICSSATTSSGRRSTTSSAASTASRSRTARPRRTAATPAGCSATGGNGTFEDVTATSGIFDTSSKSLGVAMLDDDQDGWPDLFVANDTQPNKLYRNLRNGTFKEVAVGAGLAFSADGKARAGMGVDVGDFDGSGRPALAITNFDNEMIGLYRPLGRGLYEDVAMRAGIGAAVAQHARVRLRLRRRRSRRRARSRRRQRPHRRDRAPHPRQRRLRAAAAPVPQSGQRRRFATWRRPPAPTSRSRGSGAASPCGDFDRDGDVDLLITTNNGPACLFRNDQLGGNRSLRFRLDRHEVEPRRHRRDRAASSTAARRSRAW